MRDALRALHVPTVGLPCCTHEHARCLCSTFTAQSVYVEACDAAFYTTSAKFSIAVLRRPLEKTVLQMRHEMGWPTPPHMLPPDSKHRRTLRPHG